MLNPVVISSFAVFAGTLAVVAFLQRKRKASMLPPGPPGDPLIGHLLRMPSTDSALHLHEWSKIYGPVMHLKVLGRSIIILDSYQAAVDLLDKRGLVYSDRPKFTLYELLGWDPALITLPYGNQFNKHRKMHQSYLSHNRVEDCKPMQTREARALLRNLVGSPPEKYETFLSRFATGIITQIVAGHQITCDDDPYLRMSNMVYEAMSKTGPPGGSPLDFFPLLQHFPPWFPGASHVGVIRTWRPTLRELYEYSVRTVKAQKEAGEATPSFVLEQLDQMNEGDDEEEDLEGAAATMFGAGESTTWSTLSIFVLAMILYPECQAKAQKEIDSVVGDLRLPKFEDRGNLPFVEAVLQETFRWNPALPLGVSHRAIEDDVYNGMYIPKGALVFANVRGMSLDESVYSNPKVFNPARYLPKPAGAGEPHFSDISFGFGRRVCTGQYLADNSLWIAIVSILATFTIANAVDGNGTIIVPESTLTDGLVSHPKDVRCAMVPRSPAAKLLILDS